MSEVFPPKVPCPGGCAYEDTCTPSLSDPYGCGTCCNCANACHLEHDIEQAYIPETPQQADFRIKWDEHMKNGGGPFRWA